jgi:septal ring factor EnvC (AmiA/AmiB activator)
VCAQVLHGGENLLDKVEQLKQRSAATKTQLEVAARQQAEQQRRLEELQLERLDLDAQYSSLEVGHAQGASTTALRPSPHCWPLLDDLCI